VSELLNLKVTQSNKLTQATYTMTLNEKRLLLACLAQIDPRKPLLGDGVVRVRADEFATAFGMEQRHAYEVLAEASVRLFNRQVRLRNAKSTELVRWVYHLKYYEGEGYITLAFSPTMLPLITLLHKEFTTYQLRYIAGLPSFYSIRLYELLAQFKNSAQGSRTVEIGQLREMFDLGAKYENVKDFRRRVLDPSVHEINLHTDIRAVCTPNLKGKKVVGFTFTIDLQSSQSEDLDLALEVEEPSDQPVYAIARELSGIAGICPP